MPKNVGVNPTASSCTLVVIPLHRRTTGFAHVASPCTRSPALWSLSRMRFGNARMRPSYSVPVLASFSSQALKHRKPPKPRKGAPIMDPAMSLCDGTMASGSTQRTKGRDCATVVDYITTCHWRRFSGEGLLLWPVCIEAVSVEGREEEGSRSHFMALTECEASLPHSFSSPYQFHRTLRVSILAQKGFIYSSRQNSIRARGEEVSKALHCSPWILFVLRCILPHLALGLIV